MPISMINFKSLEGSSKISIEGERFIEYSPKEAIIDLRGNFLAPKFVDGHTHIVNEINRSGWINLGSIRRKKDLLKLIYEFRGKIFLGYNWDESAWEDDPTFPNRKELDEVEFPVYLRRIDGHIAVMNTKAIELLGFRKEDFYDFERGIIVEDAVSRADKILLKYAKKNAKAVIEKVKKLGINIALDMGFSVPLEFSVKGLEIIYYIYVEPDEEFENKLRRMKSLGAKIAGIKVIADGSIGARTAALFYPYKDDPSNRGKLLIDEDALSLLVKKANSLGLQLAVHAIGDRAIDVVSNALRYGDIRMRNRVEHFEMPHEDHIKKLSKYGVIASMQPNFIANWQCKGCLYDIRLGWERAKMMNPLKTVLKHMRIAFGSDNMPMDPLYGTYGAMIHPLEEERLSFEESLRAYTYGSAYSAFINMCGIRPGCKAEANVIIAKDFSNPESVREAKIVDIKNIKERLIPL